MFTVNFNISENKCCEVSPIQQAYFILADKIIHSTELKFYPEERKKQVADQLKKLNIPLEICCLPLKRDYY